MRIFHIGGERFEELPALPPALPRAGFLWVSFARREFELGHADIQAALHRWELGALVDLHLSDLVNNQLPSHYDDTSWYDLLVFRRLATNAAAPAEGPERHSTPQLARHLLHSVDTSAVGFAVFDRVLITVHPAECAVQEHFAQRLAGLAAANGAPVPDLRGAARLPASPADLMLRMVNHMVDGYLDLRRLLTRHLGQLQQDLLNPRHRFADWGVLLDSRNALHQLEDICEDQRAAVQEWIDALDEWPQEPDAARRRERELLRVRSRDVLEHIERVLGHVRRLEQSAETVVQMHFSAQSHRTNDIMRTLTALTAVFLPLNLITGFFGMNFEF
ncbi:MAG: magnesium transporter CorA, partial [Rubrivivax sp.]|nr:magnesium transporter CorA [Rubrivivax sp.]